MGILSSLLVGLAATLGTTGIHGLVVHTVIMEMRRDLQRGRLGVRLWVSLTFVTGTTLLGLAGHILEVALWAFVFDLCGGVANFSAALYCSAGSSLPWVPAKSYCRYAGSCWDHSRRPPGC